jgi:hypothetical protein
VGVFLCIPFKSSLFHQNFRQKLKDYGLLKLSKINSYDTTPIQCGSVSFDKFFEPFGNKIKIYKMNQANLKKLTEKTFFLKLNAFELEKILEKNSKFGALLSNYKAIKKNEKNHENCKSLKFQGLTRFVLPYFLKEEKTFFKSKGLEHRFTLTHKALTRKKKSREIWFSPKWQDLYLGSKLGLH